MKKIEIYKPIIKELCEKYDIHPKWNDKGHHSNEFGPYWWADPEDREILIPNPTTSYRFLICLHEIAHVLKGFRSLSYMEEFLAEEWAIKTAAKYGVKSPRYERAAADLLVCYIKSDIYQGKTSPKRISRKVKSWIQKRKVPYYEVRKVQRRDS